MCKTNGIYAVHTIIHSNIHIYAKGAETARLRLMTDAAYRFYEHSHIIYAHHAPHTCDYQITGDRRASECVVKKKRRNNSLASSEQISQQKGLKSGTLILLCF